MKRIVTLLLAALTACLLACPALAAQYPSDIVERTDGDYPRLEKIYVLTPMDDPSEIPTADFEREGVTYTLLDLTKQDCTEADTRFYTETVTLKSDSNDMEAILPQFAATCEVTTEDGYTGLLTLDTSSIKVEADGYGTSSRTVTATRSYPNLSDADASLLPKTITDSGRTLTLADVQWEEAGGCYHASASYTGTASSKYATGYTVSADYAGDVTKAVSGTLVYTAVFSGKPAQFTGADALADTAAGHGNLTWLLILPFAAAAAGLVFLGRFLYQKLKEKKAWKEYTK